MEDPAPHRLADPISPRWQSVSLRLSCSYPARRAPRRSPVIRDGGIVADSANNRQGDRPDSGRREAAWGQVSDWLDDWLSFEADGMVTAFSGKVELGTGVGTALAQIVADELDAPLDRVHMVMGDTGRTPDEGYTAGSMTISGSGTALRKAAAEARRALLDMASARLDVAPDEMAVH